VLPEAANTTLQIRRRIYRQPELGCKLSFPGCFSQVSTTFVKLRYNLEHEATGKRQSEFVLSPDSLYSVKRSPNYVSIVTSTIRVCEEKLLDIRSTAELQTSSRAGNENLSKVGFVGVTHYV
jgi:hypothetical protein